MRRAQTTLPASIQPDDLFAASYGALLPKLRTRLKIVIGFTLCLLFGAVYDMTQTVTQTFNYNGPGVFSFKGAVQAYPAPAGISSVTVDMGAAEGGYVGGTPGKGGRVQATMSVTAGATLNVYVGAVANTFKSTEMSFMKRWKLWLKR